MAQTLKHSIDKELLQQIKELPWELQDKIWCKYWRYRWTNDVVAQLDNVLSHRLFMITESRLYKTFTNAIGYELSGSQNSQIVIKPMIYAETTLCRGKVDVIMTEFYGVPYNKSGVSRPWKVACSVAKHNIILENDKVTKYHRQSINTMHHIKILAEKEICDAYEWQLKNVRCPIITTLDKVTNYWIIGDPYYDKRDYGHMLTKV